MAGNNSNQMNCPMDCLRCSLQQRDVCKAQMTRMMFGWIKEMDTRLKSIEERLGIPDEHLFNPTDTKTFETAQSGTGAENRVPINEHSNKKDNV